MLLAVNNDEELEKLLKGVTIACGGVLPHINPVLIPKETTSSKNSFKAPQLLKPTNKSSFSAAVENAPGFANEANDVASDVADNAPPNSPPKEAPRLVSLLYQQLHKCQCTNGNWYWVGYI